MIEPRQDLSLAGEAGHAVGVGRTPDFAHSALAEFGRDAVMADGGLGDHCERFPNRITFARNKPGCLNA